MRIRALLVLVCIAALAGSAHGGIAQTSLKITLIPNAGKPKVGRRSYTLRCGPAGGTLPHAATACSKLAKTEKPFAPVPKGMACTLIYGGAQKALVAGVYNGKQVGATFTRTDGCQIARWNRVQFLLPIATGIR